MIYTMIYTKTDTFNLQTYGQTDRQTIGKNTIGKKCKNLQDGNIFDEVGVLKGHGNGTRAVDQPDDLGENFDRYSNG